MPGLTHALDIARRALNSQQSVMSVIGHNVANANTPGYTRQTAHLTAEAASPCAAHSYGNGAKVDAVLRKRDITLDSELRQNHARLGRWSVRTRMLDSVEGMINEPSESSIGAAMDEFWASWAELSQDPDDMTRRASVRERGRILAYRFNTVGSRLEQMQRDIDAELSTRLAEFNMILREIGELNQMVKQSMLQGLTPNDLRDRRDLLLDELTELAPVTYAERDDGVLSVRLDSITVVDETILRDLSLVDDTEGVGSSDVSVRFSNGNEPDITTGLIGGLLEVRHETLPDLAAGIDQLAAGLIAGVNAVHRTGPSRVDFFSGSRMVNIAVSHDIERSLREMNTSTSGLPGDNDIALGMAQMRDARIIETNVSSPREYWDALVGGLGVISRESQFQLESVEATAAALDQRRQSGTGVSLDEELANLLVAQQAYMAAVRLFEAVDEMMDVLMSL